MVAGRKGGLREACTILRKHFPGFEQAQLKAVAPLLGVRETRRIIADQMAVDDLRDGQEFPDTIGFSMYGWDLPDPNKPSVQPFVDDPRAIIDKVKKGLSTPLPYRMMVPRPIGEPDLSGTSGVRRAPGAGPGARDGSLHGHGRGQRHGGGADGA